MHRAIQGSDSILRTLEILVYFAELFRIYVAVIIEVEYVGRLYAYAPDSFLSP